MNTKQSGYTWSVTPKATTWTVPPASASATTPPAHLTGPANEVLAKYKIAPCLPCPNTKTCPNLFVNNGRQHHQEVELTPLVCGEKFFKAFADSINKAQHSIDLISWGIDTDMDMHVPSGILAELLEKAAGRNVRVNILIWEPSYFAHNVIDPCHYWFKCKMGIIPKTQFAFRECMGSASGTQKSDDVQPLTMKDLNERFEEISGANNPVLSPAKSLDGSIEKIKSLLTKNFSGDDIGEAIKKFMTESLREGGEFLQKVVDSGSKAEPAKDLDDVIKFARASFPDLDRLLWSHHQKMALIDADKPGLAHGYIMGFNMKEEYLDDTSHKAGNMLRARKLGPWQDVGVKIRGPILSDLARNMRENWEKKKEKRPLSFIVKGVSGLYEKEEKVKARVKKEVKAACDNLAAGLESVQPPPPWRYMKYNFQAYCLAWLNLFCGVRSLIKAARKGGNLADVINLAGAAREEWPCTSNDFPLSDDEPKDKNVFRQPAQYLRTLGLDDPNGEVKDFSISAGIINMINCVDKNGLIYFENQYFRDPALVEELKKLNETRSPYIIVVTNCLTNDDNEAVDMTAELGAKPTYDAYKKLKDVYDDKVLFCSMRTREPVRLQYGSPRKIAVGEWLLDSIVNYLPFTGNLPAPGKTIDETLEITDALLEEVMHFLYYAVLPLLPDEELGDILFKLEDYQNSLGLAMDRLFGWMTPEWFSDYFSDLQHDIKVKSAETLLDRTDAYSRLNRSLAGLATILREGAPFVAGYGAATIKKAKVIPDSPSLSVEIPEIIPGSSEQPPLSMKTFQFTLHSVDSLSLIDKGLYVNGLSLTDKDLYSEGDDIHVNTIGTDSADKPHVALVINYTQNTYDLFVLRQDSSPVCQAIRTDFMLNTDMLDDFWQTRKEDYSKEIAKDTEKIATLKAEIDGIINDIGNNSAHRLFGLDWLPFKLFSISLKKVQIEYLKWNIERLNKNMQSQDSQAIAGAIYVHSKVLIVDASACMIGSNNINVRSMKHDSENAVLIQDGDTEHGKFTCELRKELFTIMLGSDAYADLEKKGLKAEDIFKAFKEGCGDKQSLITRYEPVDMIFGSAGLS